MLTERGITPSETSQSHQASAANSTGKKVTRVQAKPYQEEVKGVPTNSNGGSPEKESKHSN